MTAATAVMAPSQLKQLKLSLRESGLVGPQPSRKKRRERAQTGVSAQHRIQRQAALSEIHERFNPFETKAPARNVKFAVTTRDSAGKYPGRGTIARPGVTKSLGEERVGFNESLTFILFFVLSFL